MKAQDTTNVKLVVNVFLKDQVLKLILKWFMKISDCEECDKSVSFVTKQMEDKNN